MHSIRFLFGKNGCLRRLYEADDRGFAFRRGSFTGDLLARSIKLFRNWFSVRLILAEREGSYPGRATWNQIWRRICTRSEEYARGERVQDSWKDEGIGRRRGGEENREEEEECTE